MTEQAKQRQGELTEPERVMLTAVSELQPANPFTSIGG